MKEVEWKDIEVGEIFGVHAGYYHETVNKEKEWLICIKKSRNFGFVLADNNSDSDSTGSRLGWGALSYWYDYYRFIRLPKRIQKRWYENY